MTEKKVIHSILILKNMRLIKNNIEYSKFAEELYNGCIFTDAWVDGKERFSMDYLLLQQKELDKFYKASEQIGYLFYEFTKVISQNPELIDEYFHLTPYQKAMWMYSGGEWHGIARLDLFLLENGAIQMCEMNSDTPSGEPEAVVLNEIISSALDVINPNSGFKAQFCKSVFHQWERTTEKKFNKNAPPSVAIIYPTEISEDLSMIRLYESWFKEYNCEIILGSPFNLKYNEKENKLYIFDKAVDIVIRHYKTDWWGERISPWLDSQFQDAEPLKKPLKNLISAQISGAASVFNPFGAVLSQNKLVLSFFYDYFHLFGKMFQNMISKYIPETRRLIDYESKITNKDEWVLKSNYGCEGDEVIIGKNSSEEIWQKSLEMARKEHWIVQRYFKSIRIDDNEPNFGIYLIGGKASGIFTRFAKKSTDYYSLSVATFV